jgi:hypothetical protein
MYVRSISLYAIRSRTQPPLYSSPHYFANHTDYLVPLVTAKLPALDFVPLWQTLPWTQRGKLSVYINDWYAWGGVI